MVRGHFASQAGAAIKGGGLEQPGMSGAKRQRLPFPQPFIVSHRSTPSRLPCGSLRSALTGPLRGASNPFLLRGNGRLVVGLNFFRLPS